ncbi:DUF4012 domain-containing protein [Patescibacteria group bacterium]|nr:DUF4012 domain-containing protein [Patescibacteria group bacterium]
MAKTEISLNNNERTPLAMVDFESQIASVVEQDGVVLNTPTGVKRRARRFKKIKKKCVDFIVPKNSVDTASQVEQMDKDAIACFVSHYDSLEPKFVKVNKVAHERSPFVVSLRECVLDDDKEDTRVEFDKQLAFTENLSNKKLDERVFKDLELKSRVRPWMTKGQSSGQKSTKITSLGKRLVFEFKHSVRDFKSAVGYLFTKFKKQEKRVEVDIEEGMELAMTNPPGFSFARAALGFFALAIIMTLPAQAFVLYQSFSGQSHAIQEQGNQAVAALAQVADSGDLSISVDRLENASDKFKEAEKLLDSSRLLAMGAAAVIPAKYQTARALLEVGDKTTEAGYLLATGFAKVFDDPSRDLIERLEVLGTYARGTLPLLEDAESSMDKVDMANVPEDYKDKITDLKNQIITSQDVVREFAMLSDALVGFLGKDDLKTYLFVFQNNAELRPSGGFMGSVAEIRLDRGRIESIYVPPGGTYDLKGQLTERVQSPRPLQLINPLWQFQDANWYADFPQTAEQIRWFWSKSGQPTLDGVIAVNADFMNKVLAVTGPIEMPEYGKTITADNFFIETQKAVELEYDKEDNTPKKFIGDLFDALLAKLPEMDKSDWLALAASASEGLKTKDIQVAMFDKDDAAFVNRFGWNGRLKEAPGDSLAIIGANIAGQKTDIVVEESVKHETNIHADGTITDKLIINRKHNGIKGDLFTGVRNVQYLRVYVPKGSRLISASGFEPPSETLFKKPLDTDPKNLLLEQVELSARQGPGTVWQAIEGDRTVFGGWLQLDPGMSQEIILVYEIPLSVRDIMQNLDTSPEVADESARGAYMSLFTSQSGKSRYLEHVTYIEQPWQMIWSRDLDDTGLSDQKGQIYTWSGVWNQDRVIASLLTTTKQ